MNTLEIPESFPPLIKEILMHCWKYDVALRPTFNNLLTIFDKIKADNSLLEQKSLDEIDECFALEKPEREHSQTVLIFLTKLVERLTAVTCSFPCIITIGTLVSFSRSRRVRI